MSADSAGQLLERIDARIHALMRRNEAVLATVLSSSPTVVQLDTGQIIEDPFVFGGAVPDDGARVVAVWLQGGHDVGLVVGGGADWVPVFSISNLQIPAYTNGVVWTTPPWYAPKEIDLSGRTMRLSTRVAAAVAVRWYLAGNGATTPGGGALWIDLPGGALTATKVVPEGYGIASGTGLYVHGQVSSTSPYLWPGGSTVNGLTWQVL